MPKIDEVLAKYPCINNIGDLFRLAHLSTFGTDLAPSHRVREIAAFHVTGHEPNYVTEYLRQFAITDQDKP